MKVFDGVGPDAQTVTAANGAKQSAPVARLDLTPMRALMHVGKILQEGAAKYGENNWRGLTVADHVNKALIHLAAFLVGDTTDDHLGHACCRLQMALECHLTDGKFHRDEATVRDIIAQVGEYTKYAAENRQPLIAEAYRVLSDDLKDSL